jgi:hypothetical protein
MHTPALACSVSHSVLTLKNDSVIEYYEPFFQSMASMASMAQDPLNHQATPTLHAHLPQKQVGRYLLWYKVHN